MATATAERKRAKAAGVTLNYAAFFRAVKIASNAVSRRAAKSAAGCICVGNGLVSGQTPGEYRVDVELLEASSEPMLLPQDRLSAILVNSPGTEVTLRQDGPVCVVKIGRGEWRLPTEDAAEFQLWEPAGLCQMPLLPEDQFRRAIRHVIYAIDNESSRFALGGVFVECIGDKLRFVATDGRRLSVATCSHDSATDEFVLSPKNSQKAAPIVPIKPLVALQNQCSGDSRSVSMQYGNGVFVGNVGDVTVTATTIQGRYVKWADVFPDDLPPGNSVDRDELLAAVRSASVVTSEASRGVTFVFRNGTLTLKAKSSEGGESEVECDVAQSDCDATVMLAPQFVMDFLKPFDKDFEPCVSIHVCKPDGRTVLTVGDDYTGVVMPLDPGAA